MKLNIKKFVLFFTLVMVIGLSGCVGEATPPEETILPSLPTEQTPDEIHDSPNPSNDTRQISESLDGMTIIDNRNKEFTYTSAILRADTANSTVIGANYIESANGTDFKATWRPTIETAGYYKIYMTWPEKEGAYSKVPIEVDYEGGNNTDSIKTVDQTMNQGLWVMIGTYYFTTGTDNAVHIYGLDNHVVYADAVMFDLSYAQETLQTETKLEALEVYEPTSVTKIVRTFDNDFRLSVDGEIFFVNGVNGIDELELIAEAGGNSVRTYSVDALNDGELLDRAYDLGIKVVIGLWLNHESSSFTYANSHELVQQQYEKSIADVEKYKKHPAVMAWAVGNEVDSTASADMSAIHRAFNDIAKYIHENDPYHPTMVVLAGSHPTKINGIRKDAPHVDIIGINTYSAIANAQINIAPWRGPYMITEYAVNQPSEIRIKTEWGAVIEPTSLEKADFYYNRHEEYIYGLQDQNVVGGYVFKDTGSFRVTHTWYGIILYGLKTPAYHAMQATWNQTERVDVPYISSVKVDGKVSLESVKLDANESYEVEIIPSGLTDETVEYQYEIRGEVPISSNSRPAVLTEVVFTSTSDPKKAIFNAPIVPGNYRIYVYMETNGTDISSYSFPLQVTGEPYTLEDLEGVVIVTNSDPVRYIENGVFSNSSNRLYDGFPTRFTREEQAYATYTPELEGPGNHEVFFYNLSEGLGQTDDTQIEIQIHHANGAIETIVFNATTTADEWISLGTYAFSADGLENVRITKILSGTKVTRATAIAFLPVE